MATDGNMSRLWIEITAKPPFDNFLVYAAFVLVGWASLAGLGYFLFLFIFDRISIHKDFFTESTGKERSLLRLLGVPLALFIAVPIAPQIVPAIFAVFGMALLLCRRVPVESETLSSRVHYRWVVRFSLVQLLGSTLVLGAAMGWYLR